jgi:hypothetical protein
VEPLTASLNLLAKGVHVFGQNRLREFTAAAQLE